MMLWLSELSMKGEHLLAEHIALELRLAQLASVQKLPYALFLRVASSRKNFHASARSLFLPYKLRRKVQMRVCGYNSESRDGDSGFTFNPLFSFNPGNMGFFMTY